MVKYSVLEVLSAHPTTGQVALVWRDSLLPRPARTSKADHRDFEIQLHSMSPWPHGVDSHAVHMLCWLVL